MNFAAATTVFLAEGTVAAGIPGSRVVQIVLTLLFFVLMFASSFRGYNRGPIRQIAPLAAFIVAATVAWFFGAPFGHAWLGVIGVPWIFRGFCGSVLLCLFVWLPIFAWLWHKGRKQVSEKTGEPEQPVLGALVGCWTGIFWGALVLGCISAAGAVGETYLTLRPGYEKTICGKLLYAVAKAKNSVALYPRLSFLKSWSPLPESAFYIVGKVLDVLASREAQQRLLLLPEIRSLATDPVVYPVLSDPEIEEMIDRRDIEGLLADKRVLRMLSDENFQRRIAALELEPLLDYALEGGPPPISARKKSAPDVGVPATATPAEARPNRALPATGVPAEASPAGPAEALPQSPATAEPEATDVPAEASSFKSASELASELEASGPASAEAR